MTITFSEIAVDLRIGGAFIEFDNSRAQRADSGIPSRALLLGQRLSGSAGAPLLPYRISQATDAEGLFGRGSMLHRMARAFRAANEWTELWAIALDDVSGGTAAVGSLAFAGTPTQAGTIHAMICGRALQVPVSLLSTAADLAAGLRDAINAQTDLPVTAALHAGLATQVDVTARHKGEVGNRLQLGINYYAGNTTPGGITVSVVQPTGGATNPDLATALAKMSDVWYSDIVCPYVDGPAVATLAAELRTRRNAMVAQDAVAYLFHANTYGGLATYGAALNSPDLTIGGLNGSPTPTDELAAAYAGVSAWEYKQDPARGLRGLLLPGALPPRPADRFTRAERNNLLHDGISTFITTAGGDLAIERAITTYQTTPTGVDDTSYLDVATAKTLANCRYSMVGHIARTFPRHKLASDTSRLPAGQPIATPRTIRGELVAAYAGLIARGLTEDMEGFKRDCLVERDAADRSRVNAVLPVRLIGRAETFAMKLQFLT